MFPPVGSSMCGGRSYAILENFFRSFAKAAGYPDEKQYAVMKDVKNVLPLPPREMESAETDNHTDPEF